MILNNKSPLIGGFALKAVDFQTYILYNLICGQ
jgi:hypothetical protein